MDIFRSVTSVARINFLRWKGDHRIWSIFLFIGLFLINEVKPLTEYGMDIGGNCTGFLLPIIFRGSSISTGIMKILLYLGCLLLLCDAPFIYQITPYMVNRSKRQGWWMGECIYILVVTFIYTTFITLVSTAVVLPVATFGDSWGNVIRGFAFGDTSMVGMDSLQLKEYYGLHMAMPTTTIGALYPSGAQIYTFVTVWVSFFFLGLLQYLVSLKSKSMFLGFVAAGIFVFFDPILNGLYGLQSFHWVQVLSPVCWVNTEYLYEVSRIGFLRIPYIVVMFVVLITVLLLAIRFVSKRIMIEVRGEV